MWGGVDGGAGNVAARPNFEQRKIQTVKPQRLVLTRFQFMDFFLRAVQVWVLKVPKWLASDFFVGATKAAMCAQCKSSSGRSAGLQ